MEYRLKNAGDTAGSGKGGGHRQPKDIKVLLYPMEEVPALAALCDRKQKKREQFLYNAIRFYGCII